MFTESWPFVVPTVGWPLDWFELERLLFSTLGIGGAAGAGVSSTAGAVSLCDKARGVRGGVLFESSVSSLLWRSRSSGSGDKEEACAESGTVIG